MLFGLSSCVILISATLIAIVINLFVEKTLTIPVEQDFRKKRSR